MNIKPIGTQVGIEAPKANRRAESAESTDSSSSKDRVELSAEAQRLAGLAKVAQRLPAIREERVGVVREAIENGTYRVDARQLARSILEFEDGLGD